MAARLMWLLKGFGWMFLGGLLALLLVYVLYLEGRPDLEIWHQVDLDEDLSPGRSLNSMADYLAIEDRVFKQLDRLIVDQVPVNRNYKNNRFSRDSASDPAAWPRNWNRTFELTAESPRAAVLLLHGMSDSPYSLRALGQQLHKQGAWVLGLRTPGHGTAPSGLTSLRWQDMARAVDIAMQHLQEQVPDQPIFIVGYSAGGALAVHYALRRLEHATMPAAAGLVLISPAIGVSPLAAMAVWQGRLGYLLGLDKLQWTDLRVEYDPFKYNSFAVNAGDQVYRLTEEISTLLSNRDSAQLKELPPILALQSGVDATVSPGALVEGLFARLPPGGHELFLFDINRNREIQWLVENDPRQTFDTILGSEQRPYTLSILSNRSDQSNAIRLLRKPALDGELQAIDLPAQWPEKLYSLSHVALPFSPDDPLYGRQPGKERKHIQLGDVALHGERGTLRILPSDMLRLKWNPFYSLMQDHIFSFMALQERP